MLERYELLTMKEAADLIRYSYSWLVLHCGDTDFPRRYHVFDNRTKYLKKDDFLEYCELHDIELIKKPW